MWGVKKNLFKAAQRFSEIIGTTEGTKFDKEVADYKTDLSFVVHLLNTLYSRTQEIMEPNLLQRGVGKLTGVKKYQSPERIMCNDLITGVKLATDNEILKRVHFTLQSSMDMVASQQEQMNEQLENTVLTPITIFKEEKIKPIQACIEMLRTRRLSYDSFKDANAQKEVERTKYEKVMKDFVSMMEHFISNDLDDLDVIVNNFLTIYQMYHQKMSEIVFQFLNKNSNNSVQNDGSLVSDNQDESSNSVAPCIRKCELLFTTEPAESDELKADEGDIVYFVCDVDESWCYVTFDYNGGDAKLVPKNHLKFL